MSAANLGFAHGFLGFGAVGFEVNLFVEDEKAAAYFGFENEVFAGIGGEDGGNGASGTQVGLPLRNGCGWVYQAAFFMVSATMVVSIKVFAFFTGWGFHGGLLIFFWGCFTAVYLHRAVANFFNAQIT